MSNEIDIRNTLTPAPVGAQGASEAERRQVRNLAEQFEAMLMTQMLREMRRSMLSGLEDDEDKSTGFGSGALMDTIDVQLGLALSRAGGFGLSSVLLGGLEKLTGAAKHGDISNAVREISAGQAPMVPEAATPADIIGSVVAPWAPSLPVRDNLTAGRISSAFGWRSDPLTGAQKFHQGVDIAMPVGRDVVAAERGRVVFSGEQSGFGNTILIDHGNGRQTRYAHLSEQVVRAGAEVAAGQLIGKSGASGRVTGPHLHFEVLVNGKAVNPAD